jgi:hypothetical protein
LFAARLLRRPPPALFAARLIRRPPFFAARPSSPPALLRRPARLVRRPPYSALAARFVRPSGVGPEPTGGPLMAAVQPRLAPTGRPCPKIAPFPGALLRSRRESLFFLRRNATKLTECTKKRLKWRLNAV